MLNLIMMDLPQDLIRNIKTGLKSVIGQLKEITRMLDDGREPEQILIQFKAVQHAVNKSHFLLLDETYRKALAIKIVETVDACPGNCGNEGKIEYLRQQFPDLSLDDLSQKLKEISELRKRI